MKKHTNIVMAYIFVALGVMLASGLIEIPAIDQAQTSNAISDSRNKGQSGFERSGGQGGSSNGCDRSCNPK